MKKKFEKVFFILANFFFQYYFHSGPENFKKGPNGRKKNSSNQSISWIIFVHMFSPVSIS